MIVFTSFHSKGTGPVKPFSPDRREGATSGRVAVVPVGTHTSRGGSPRVETRGYTTMSLSGQSVLLVRPPHWPRPASQRPIDYLPQAQGKHVLALSAPAVGVGLKALAAQGTAILSSCWPGFCRRHVLPLASGWTSSATSHCLLLGGYFQFSIFSFSRPVVWFRRGLFRSE